MKSRILTALVVFILCGIIGLVIVHLNIPKPVEQGIPTFFKIFIEFLLISLGPLTILSVASSANGPVVGILLIVGIISGILFLKIVKSKNINIAFITIPVLFWYALGVIGLIWSARAAI